VVLLGAGYLAVEVVLPLVAGAHLLSAGSAAPAISLRDDLGKQHDVFTEAHGRAVLIDFFDTDCDNCSAEVPALCALVRQHTDLYVVGVEAGGHGAGDVAAFARNSGGGCLTIPLLVDPGRDVSAAYGILDVPASYLVSNGKVVAAGLGADRLTAVASS
jgi:peroxiredoxin